MKKKSTIEKKNIHLLCNAHLDPVWVWEWEEGVAETLSTFRTAAELCEQNKTFVFNHNEAILYQWIQEYEPDLFKRIQKIVTSGRWHIMGGWYLQPDCNMPSGEGLVRQVLAGRAYFKEHFGVTPRTAINFDPFGHSRGLVQILKKSGFDSYVFGRPDQNDCPLPADEFVWVGYDGSEVMATRFCGWYNSPLGKAKEKIEKWLEDNPDKKHSLILWGVGNHGGGPSKIDVAKVNDLIRKRSDVNILHSTPEAFFRELKKDYPILPKHEKDLNSWSPGCYTSQIRLKRKYRQLENQLFMTEKMAATAAVQGLISYPHEEFDEASKAMLWGQFHDVLPGSSIQPVEDASICQVDHGLELLSRVKARAFFALSSGQPKAKEGQIPIMVYNPHPFKIEQQVECEFNLPDTNGPDDYTPVKVYHNGRRLLSQVEHETSFLGFDWRKRIVFNAQLQPGQMNRFDCRLEPKLTLSQKPKPKLKIRNGKLIFKVDDIYVVINTKTGLVDKYRVKGVDFLCPNAFEPLVMKDQSDSWVMVGKSFREVEGQFKLMSKKAGSAYSGVEKGLLDSVRVIEDGPVRTVVEAVFSYGSSFICQRYKLPKKGTEIEIEVRVLWNEKSKMLKLSVPTRFKNAKYMGQVVYGVDELPDNGKEAVAQKWVAVVSDRKGKALTCINDRIYGSDYSSDGLRLTLLRSPVYSCSTWAGKSLLVTDRFTPRMDQGEHIFRFWFNAGDASERLGRIDREALVKNEVPFALSFFPPGKGKTPKSIAVLSDKVIQVAAIKRTEIGDDVVIRLFEPTGRKRKTTLSLPFINKKVKFDFDGFEIKTLKIDIKKKKVKEVNLLEENL